jgi:hypothetical protein
MGKTTFLQTNQKRSTTTVKSPDSKLTHRRKGLFNVNATRCVGFMLIVGTGQHAKQNITAL